MSSNCVFVKVSKKDGFVREDNWKPIDIIGCSCFIEYLEEALALPNLEVGDSVCFLDDYKLSYVDIKHRRDLETYHNVRLARIGEIVLGECNEEVNYRMTEERISDLFNYFDEWSRDKSPEDIKNQKELLNDFKKLTKEVDFKKENMVFTYHY